MLVSITIWKASMAVMIIPSSFFKKPFIKLLSSILSTKVRVGNNSISLLTKIGQLSYVFYKRKETKKMSVVQPQLLKAI